MGNRKELSSAECKQLYLEMMDEIDSFCRKNEIRYSLTSGTLIGAIRHKGFIPWDDDLDIMMPLPDMIKFKKSFKSNNLRYLDIDIDNNFTFAFSRIESTKTYSHESPFSYSYGLCIDLYPILGLPKRNIEIDNFFFSARKLLQQRMRRIKWQNRLNSYIPFFHFQIAAAKVRDYRNFMMQFPYGKTGRYYHFGGAPNWAAVLDKDYFDDLIDVDFAGRKYLGISDFDMFLSNGYGNYMQLPPEEDRIPYDGGHYYWK